MEFISQAIVANLPAVLLLVVGFILVVVEMYVPGFGIPGISGIACLIAGVIIKAESALEALIMAIVIIVLLCIALSISIRSVSKGRLSKSRLVLHETATDAENIGTNDLKFYLGREGVTSTVLRPAGMGEFDGVKLNIVSDGEFIAAGEKVRVVSVEGNRIVVNAVKAS
ncbi:MAG: NfeD family protein [Eubacteriales bacterium]|nr:NfeD family protein [Eubacteriales bacterium]